MAPAGGLAAPAAAFAGLRGQGRAEESGQEAQGEADGGAADRDVS
ncbi:protein of unassigned function [Methylobacterium oryzae CBMB20]|uniref:Protein of unassigned function n=1 Tax=Methylobacterium oryzae CBMB20 TaxID=693986 RepID=A0A089NT19_9HYPH|nr:protein of unassigned function [Methylobacterium oryzae CBMB20]